MKVVHLLAFVALQIYCSAYTTLKGPFPWKGSLIATDSENSAIDTSDIDQDGDTDVIACSNSTRITVYENNVRTANNFTAHPISYAENNVGSIKSGDLDGDGIPEIVCVNSGNGVVRWFDKISTATWAFNQYTLGQIENGPKAVAVADLDDDHDLDIVLVSSGGSNVVWYENDGKRAPGFTRHVIDEDLEGAGCVDVADMNHDGALDILAGSYDTSQVALYLNQNKVTPSFTRINITSEVEQPTNLGAVDFDNDGDMDIYVYGHQQDDVNWFRNNGETVPSFTGFVIFNPCVTGGYALGVADVDLDGRVDLIARSHWFRNEAGSIPFFNPLTSNAGVSDANVIHMARIDADEFPDLVSESRDGICWFRNLCIKTAEIKPIAWSPKQGQVVSIAARLQIASPPFYIVERPLSAEWQVSVDPDLSSPVFNGIDMNQDEIIIPQGILRLNSTYSWRARWLFSDGYTQWSDVSQFQTAPRAVKISNDSSNYGTIQSAIDVAPEGAEVIVPPAEYVENICLLGKNLRVHSEDPLNSRTVATTIINGDAKDSTVVFAGTEGPDCVLAGFTIRNGRASQGGGIRGNACTAVIERNVITSNTASVGAGVYGCNGTIQYNNFIYNVSTGEGGGICDCAGPIRGNYFTLNNASSSKYPNTSAVIVRCSEICNNLISGNQCIGVEECVNVHSNKIIGNEHEGVKSSSNIYKNEIAGNMNGVEGCENVFENLISANGHFAIIESSRVYRNTITKHTEDYGGGVIVSTDVHDNLIIQNAAVMGRGYGGIYYCKNVYNNTLVGNKIQNDEPIVNCIVRYYSGSIPAGSSYNCINVDPQFVDPLREDYRLKPSSPCIDAGKRTDSQFDLNQVPRGLRTVGAGGDGSCYDIGACEYIASDFVVFEPKSGDTFLVGSPIRVSIWHYQPNPNDRIVLQLVQGDKILAELGVVTDVAGYQSTGVKLPIVPSGPYQIRACSAKNSSTAALSGAFSLTSINSVPGTNWQMYE